MNKEDLSADLAVKFFITQTEAEKMINFIFEDIADFLSINDRVYFRGFGTFKRVKRKSKKVRNMKTGRIITIPAKWTVKFTPSKKLEKRMKSIKEG